MPIIFFLLLLSSVIMFILGLIKPSIFQKIIKKIPARKNIALFFGGLIFFSFVMLGLTAPRVENNNKNFLIESQTTTEDISGVVQNISSTFEKNANITDQNNASTQERIVNSTSQISTSVQELKQKSQNSETKNVQNNPIISQPISSSSKNSTQLYLVSNVVDGDTIKVNIDGKTETLRLIGLDTPETVDPRKSVQCYGKEASNKAKELLLGKKVKLESDSTQGERDKYDRLLRYVWLEDGTFYNKKMISDGYAHEYTYNTPYKYQAEFKAAQKFAQSNQLGFWSTDTCNGDTTSPVTGIANLSVVSTTKQVTSTQITQTTGKYYTSSASNSTCYYPEICDAWKKLSPNNLKIFNSLEDLKKVYPTKTLCKTCIK